MLKKILFGDKKLSGKGLTLVLYLFYSTYSKTYTNNSSKAQITKQVYNVLNKAITYK